jgi:hypothetical protein
VATSLRGTAGQNSERYSQNKDYCNDPLTTHERDSFLFQIELSHPKTIAETLAKREKAAAATQAGHWTC